MEPDRPTENNRILRALLHDLANPLGLILNAVSCLEESDPDLPPPHFFIAKIKKAALEQKAILEMTRALRTFLQDDGLLQLAPINMDDVAQACIERFGEALEAKEIDLEFAIERDEDAILLAEPAGFQMIVMDALISNALRFSPKQTTITVQAKRLDNRNEICVKDSGVGMPRRVYDNLFDLGKRIRMPDLEGNLGPGLGLPLLKRYLDRCEATIMVSSRTADEFPQGHGTEVTISFKVPCKE